MKEAIAKLYIASNGSMLASMKSGNERVLCGLLYTSLTAFFWSLKSGSRVVLFALPQMVIPLFKYG